MEWRFSRWSAELFLSIVDILYFQAVPFVIWMQITKLFLFTVSYNRNNSTAPLEKQFLYARNGLKEWESLERGIYFISEICAVSLSSQPVYINKIVLLYNFVPCWKSSVMCIMNERTAFSARII